MKLARAIAPFLAVGIAGIATTAATRETSASDPIGIYALVDSVVFIPTQATAREVQIWGAFAVGLAGPRDVYRPARRGYLYFAMDSSQRTIITAEWNDLRSVSGKREIVGFGSRWVAGTYTEPRVRCVTEARRSPDKYFTGFGVVRGIGGAAFFNQNASAIEIDLLAKSVPTATCPTLKS